MMNEGEAHLLTPSQFEHYWPMISVEMDKVKHTWEIWWTKEAIYSAVMDGWLHAWSIGNSEEIHLVAFTQVMNYPANRNLRVVLVVGNELDKYYDITEATIEKFAINNGCVYIETNGRPGWRRRVKNVQYHGVTLTRKLGTTRVQ